MALFHSFFCARPFDPKLGSTLIYFSYLHMTIRQKYMVLFHLFLLLCTTIRQKYMVLFYLFLVLCTTIRPKVRVSLICLFYLYTSIRPKIRVLINLFFYLHTTIRPNYRVLFHLFYSFFSARPFDQKLESSLIYFFRLHTTIRQKYMIFYLSFIHSLGGHSYSFIYSFLRCANISFAIFMADTALIFPSLCFWQYSLDILSAIFLVVLPISFVHYIHRRAALIFRTLYPWLYGSTLGKT